MHEETEARTPDVRIESVAFDNSESLPRELRLKTAALLRGLSFKEDSDWVRESENDVRGLWQDEGYFTVDISISARLRHASNTLTKAALSVRISDVCKYRLGTLRFGRSTVLSQEQLRSLFGLHEGDTFRADKIKEFLTELKARYGSQGYIDMVVFPETQVDRVNRKVSLMLGMEEGKVFQVASVEILGLGEDVKEKLQSVPKIGELFNTDRVDAFFRENSAFLPADASSRDDIDLRRDIRNGTVSLVFDFRGCLQRVRLTPE